MMPRRVKPHEIPLRLLEQKKVWDLKVFYELAMVAHGWLAYVIGPDDDPWGAIILEDNPLGMSIFCQTLIIDKARRTPERVSLASNYVYLLAREAAKQRGRRYLMTAVQDPDKFMEMIGNPPDVQVIETILRKEI